MYLALNNHPKRESVVQRQFILPLYPVRSQDRSMCQGGNVTQKIINNALCISYLFIKMLDDLFGYGIIYQGQIYTLCDQCVKINGGKLSV